MSDKEFPWGPHAPPLSAPPAPAAAPPPHQLSPVMGTDPDSQHIRLFDQSPEQVWNAHLAELERWAEANRKDARNDTLAFWALKVPAIVASASAGIWAHFEWTTVSVISGAVASVCVIVDGILPRGMLRNTHLRAFHDLRILTSRMTAQLRSSDGKPEVIVRKIIRESEAERERIAAYIRDAETALKPGDKG